MQILEFTTDSLRFLEAVPERAPENGFIWLFLDRDDFVQHQSQLQLAAQRLGGSAMLDVHLEDLRNAQHPSNYDFTSIYDLIIFRRLATPYEMQQENDQDAAIHAYHGQTSPGLALQIKRGKDEPHFKPISSKAVGFAVYDRLLITIHPRGCYSARNFVQRYLEDAKNSVDAAAARNRIPTSPADLALRMINVMVDSYLDLRKELSAQLDHWQAQLLKPSSRFNNWGALMKARSQLHVLEDLCDEQHDAMQEWLDTIHESPLVVFNSDNAKAQSQRDQLTARARDVMEHITRVMHHARRLEQSAETVVQIHFSAQSNRTNDIMRTLTALTAIFLPLNLIAGIFGMNFEFLPFIHERGGFWWALGGMALTAVTLGLVFWRKRYLARTRG
ncbi:magnesium transporter CorA family protein [Variovorax sp. PCZ-1]|uniref:magnesium transporter CorA family protein n=1 Tax=Variovorax sp. PCZ-1 TaxID=2835533 RepID=UPI001BCDE747|nr:magnesium transporter CorA family protein [Variovorax sp. PCZ-1]MBS7809206.1 magnesium transporter CorA family protein [Variovorax sp. PCZ-1]